VPFRDFGIERAFLHHASRGAVLAELGLTAQDISRAIVETVARLEHVASSDIGDEGAGVSRRAEAEGVDDVT
jgi:1-deoxy-D-xylulose-5-phosphate synthase